MIYQSTHSDDYLWYLILREKNENTPEYKVPPHFQWSEQKGIHFRIICDIHVCINILAYKIGHRTNIIK